MRFMHIFIVAVPEADFNHNSVYILTLKANDLLQIRRPKEVMWPIIIFTRHLDLIVLVQTSV